MKVFRIVQKWRLLLLWLWTVQLGFWKKLFVCQARGPNTKQLLWSFVGWLTESMMKSSVRCLLPRSMNCVKMDGKHTEWVIEIHHLACRDWLIQSLSLDWHTTHFLKQSWTSLEWHTTHCLKESFTSLDWHHTLLERKFYVTWLTPHTAWKKVLHHLTDTPHTAWNNVEHHLTDTHTHTHTQTHTA